MDLVVKTVHDGQRNGAIQVTGVAPLEWSAVADVVDMKPQPRELVIDAVYYFIADKVQVTLGWQSDEETVAFLPLGGRGRVDMSEISGLKNIAKGPGHRIVLKAEGEGLFTVALDLSKHIGG